MIEESAPGGVMCFITPGRLAATLVLIGAAGVEMGEQGRDLQKPCRIRSTIVLVVFTTEPLFHGAI